MPEQAPKWLKAADFALSWHALQILAVREDNGSVRGIVRLSVFPWPAGGPAAQRDGDLCWGPV